MRRVLIYFIAAIAAAFLWVLIISPTTYAADATWSSTSAINYKKNIYSGPANEVTNKNLGLTKEAQAYTYVEPVPTDTTDATTIRKIHVIYFASSDTINVATSAKYKTYIYQGPNDFTNPSSTSDIAIDKQSAASNPGTTSCSVTGGLGWIICPVTNFLASGMDWVFNILSGFLNVRPVSSSPDTALFRAWTYMRSFANVAFVIAFLIIIYSQLTSFGISNYGIKKLLPRLIIAALLVNLSYYICAIAVDISNILGYSIQGVFINIRNGLVGTEGNSWNVISFSSIAGFVLSGGTLATAGTIGLVTTLSTYGIAGSIFLLLPSLVAGLVAVLISLLIMAARQAIVTILIILAPLAFVAYLLPNTEKWFEKWQSTFLTMLIIFPAFSVIFGGSQLAAAAIIQNADSINLVILGMLIQVAPLFITPLLINLSGSILGKLAGFVNNPNKGIIDRTRKFTDDRTGNIAAKRLAETAKRGQFLRHNAQRRDNNRQRRETRRKIHEGMSETRFKDSEKYTPLHQMAYSADTEKQRVDQTLDRNLKNKIRNSPGLLNKEMEVRVLTDQAAISKARIDEIHENMRGGEDTSATGSLTALVNRSQVATRDIAITGLAIESAKRVQQSKIHEALTAADGAMARAAGGIDTYGEARAKAGATAAISKAVSENVAAAGTLLSSENYTPVELLAAARGQLRAGVQATSEQQQAAAQQIIQIGYEPDMATLIDNTSAGALAAQMSGVADPDNISLQKALGSYLAGSSKKPKYFPGPMLGALSRGEMTKSVSELVIGTLMDEKLSMEVIGAMPVEEMNRIRDILETPAALDLTAEKRTHINELITKSMTDDTIKAKFTPVQIKALDEIMDRL